MENESFVSAHTSTAYDHHFDTTCGCDDCLIRLDNAAVVVHTLTQMLVAMCEAANPFMLAEFRSRHSELTAVGVAPFAAAGRDGETLGLQACEPPSVQAHQDAIDGRVFQVRPNDWFYQLPAAERAELTALLARWVDYFAGIYGLVISATAIRDAKLKTTKAAPTVPAPAYLSDAHWSPPLVKGDVSERLGFNDPKDFTHWCKRSMAVGTVREISKRKIQLAIDRLDAHDQCKILPLLPPSLSREATVRDDRAPTRRMGTAD